MSDENVIEPGEELEYLIGMTIYEAMDDLKEKGIESLPFYENRDNSFFSVYGHNPNRVLLYIKMPHSPIHKVRYG